MIRLLCVTWFLAAAPLAAAADYPEIELPTESRGLSHRLVPRHTRLSPLWADEHWVRSVLLRDIDGDGFPERFRTGNPEIVADDLNPEGGMGNLWWHNIPTGWLSRRPCAALEGIWDVSGSGVLEVVAMTRTEDRFRWRIERLRADTGELVAHYELAGGEDLRSDGKWDGFYKVIGCIDSHLPDRTRRVLILAATAGHDEQPRGILALDVATGEIAWTYFVGPKPLVRTLQVVDLDGDGRREICFGGSAVNNLDGKKVHGTGDDRPGVFVLNDDGTLAWSLIGEEGTGGNFVETADAGGDGRSELYVARSMARRQSNELLVLGHDGTLLQQAEIDGGIRDLFVSQAGQGAVHVTLCLDGGRIARYSYDGTSLVRVGGVQYAHPLLRIGTIADLTPDPGLEILLGDADHNLWLVDASFRPLAYTRIEKTDLWAGAVVIWDHDPGPPIVVLETRTEEDRASFRIEKAPREFPVAQVGALGVLAGGAAAIWWRRKRRPAPGTVREYRLQLLGRLKLASHGKIGALSALRRLVWLHETRSQGFALNGEPRTIFRTLGEELLGTGLPGLHGALDLAEMAELDRDLVVAARRSLERLDEALCRLAGEGYDETALGKIADDLGETTADAESAFQELRRAVEGSFRADPREIFQRSLTAHQEILRAGGVTVDIPPGEAPICRVDAEEMTFVLDNLVENALRAMADSPTPRLTIGWEVDEGEVTILVSDTGCGIIPDDWGRVFSPGFSQRKGGGLGLPGSLEIVKKYGGSLCVRESSPGSGTTIQVRCPVARHDDGH